MKGTMVEADPGTWYLRVYDRIADRQVRRTVKGSKRQAETELARFVAEATPRAQEPLSCKGFDVVDMSPTSGWDQRVEGGSMRWALILWARASRSCWFSACSSARRARRASSCWRRESAVVCSAVGVDVRPVRGWDWRRWLLPRRGATALAPEPNTGTVPHRQTHARQLESVSIFHGDSGWKRNLTLE